MIKKKLQTLWMFLACLMLVCLITHPPAWSDTDQIEAWFHYANEDYEAANTLFEEGGHFRAVCFYSHQAVEKKLKGVLYESGVRPQRTHHISKLAKKLDRVYSELQYLQQTLKWLDNLYLSSRYPQKERMEFNNATAQECVRSAGVIMDFFDSNTLRV